MSDQQNDRFARSFDSLRSSFTTMCISWELFYRNFFTNEWIFELGIQKNFYCSLTKISLYYQTVNDQRVTVRQQLFSWTSVGASICPINKMIGLPGHRTVWGVPKVSYILNKKSFTENFLEMINSLNWTL